MSDQPALQVHVMFAWITFNEITHNFSCGACNGTAHISADDVNENRAKDKAQAFVINHRKCGPKLLNALEQIKEVFDQRSTILIGEGDEG